MFLLMSERHTVSIIKNEPSITEGKFRSMVVTHDVNIIKLSAYIIYRLVLKICQPHSLN